MREVRFSASLAIKLEPIARRAVEELALEKHISLGEAARALINAGIEARGIEC